MRIDPYRRHAAHGADAVVMLEYTQSAQKNELEIFRAIADGENVIRIGEDVAQGQVIQARGSVIASGGDWRTHGAGNHQRPVSEKIQVGLISTGDEVIDPHETPRPGQVRDINSYTLGALVEKSGGNPKHYGIISDTFEALKERGGNKHCRGM
jgi:molybdopterin molybdotransferase